MNNCKVTGCLIVQNIQQHKKMLIQKNNNKLSSWSEQQCPSGTYKNEIVLLRCVVRIMRQWRERDRAHEQHGEVNESLGRKGRKHIKPTKAQLVIYTGESENETVIFPSSKKKASTTPTTTRTCTKFNGENPHEGLTNDVGWKSVFVSTSKKTIRLVTQFDIHLDRRLRKMRKLPSPYDK